MADDTDDGSRNEVPDAEELRALGEVRAALEAAEKHQGGVLRERRRLRAELDALLDALREDAVVLLFDRDGELEDADGAVREQLGVSPGELVADFNDFADDETVEALEEANRAVLDADGASASISDGFLKNGGDDLAVTFVHVRRTDDDGDVLGTEAIGLVAPALEADEERGAAPDPLDAVLRKVSRRLAGNARGTDVERALQGIGDAFDVDRVVLNRYGDEERRFRVTGSWLRADTRPLPAEEAGLPISELPWAYSALGAGEAVVISGDIDLPPEARREKDVYAGDEVTSTLLVPLVRGDALLGFLSFQSVRRARDWPDHQIGRAEAFAALLTAALVRSELEAELDELRRNAELAGAERDGAAARTSELEQELKTSREQLDRQLDELGRVQARVEELERDLEGARAGEAAAREAADRGARELRAASEKAEQAIDELEQLRVSTGDSRDELQQLKEQAESAQRRSEGAAADALAVREELEETRRQLLEARREAADLRASAGERPGLAGSEGGDQPDRIEVAGFDPDATIEMEPASDLAQELLSSRGLRSDAGDADDLASDVDEPEGGAPSEAHEDAPDSRPPAMGLDAVLEPTQSGVSEGEEGAEDEAARWKEDKTSWEDNTDEVELPEFLGSGGDRSADVATGERDDPGDERDDWDADRAPEDDEHDHVEAARELARQVAGKQPTGDIPAEDEEAEVAIEAAWEGDDDADALDELGTEPPVQQPEQFERTGELDAYVAANASDEAASDDDLAADDTGAAALPDLPGFDVEAGLADVGDNVELYRNLLVKFRKDYRGAADKIASAIDKGNVEVAHLLLHAVKGVAGVLGARRVRDGADELEGRLIGADDDARRRALDKFSDALHEAMDSISALDGTAAVPAPRTTPRAPEREDEDKARARVVEPAEDTHVSDPMVLRSYLTGLRAHLLAEKPRQCMLVMREITARNWPDDYNDRVAELAALVDDGDFKGARDSYEELMAQFPAR